jgi:hypothetical protein
VQTIDHVKTAALTKLDIEINYIWDCRSHDRHRFIDGAGLGSDAKIIELGDKPSELRSGRWLVVDDNHGMAHSDTGKLTVTTVPRGRRAAKPST